jgi:NAD(P)-dependent dehydrogenase (short-subunit alcohol dehydrogenase family)
MNIIIIGATSGIGKALYEKYATDGNRIGIVGRRTLLRDHGDRPLIVFRKDQRPMIDVLFLFVVNYFMV